MFPSIRSFLAFSYTLLVVMIIAVLGFAIQALIERQLRQNLDKDLIMRGRQVSAFILSDSDTDLSQRVSRLAESLNLVGSGGNVIYIRLYDEAGKPLPLQGQTPPIPGISARRLNHIRSARLRTVHDANGDFRVLTRPVLADGKPLAYMQVGRDLAPIERLTSQLEHALLVGGFLAAVVAATTSYFLAYQALKPFSAIVEDTRTIGVDDLSRRLPADYGVGEVSRLADSFNVLLDDLQKSFDLQRRFVADASHELRTPLTTIRGNVDVLMLDPDLPDHTRSALQQVSSEAARLSRLITNLLMIARADAGQGRPAFQRVDLHGIVLETVHQTLLMADGIALRLAREDQAVVSGDADQIKQVVLNLLDNAIKYTPAGGTVTVSVYREDGWAKIAVADTGSGIAEFDLDSIFERFYRGQQRSAGSSGSGLGLSIVDSVVHAHGGKVTVESELGRGSTFTVWLPLLEAAGPSPSDPEPQILTKA